MKKTTNKTTKKRLRIKDLPEAKRNVTGKEMKRVKGGSKHPGVNNFRVFVITN